MRHFKVTVIMALSLTSLTLFAQEYWRGLVVKPEDRCSEYNKKEQYPYSQSIEDEIVAQMGGLVYGPYTGTYFESDTETDIEHIVAASEGHDSGLCAASPDIRRQFATDLLNLTLAAPKVNRCGSTGKCGLDAAEWLPEKNKCWFADRVVQIKTKYGLSVDRAEADALEGVLVQCDSTDMEFYSTVQEGRETVTASEIALELYDDNRNGRISCAEARKHGIAPVLQGHPAYMFMNDADGDGVVCEL
ncbi:excalibur calcium-binding domain-containing protein [Alteromonas sp. CYL-A6]|uniref:excalibur calcium-binding domain-containing protein n=1 Tax=Alteromonas nitratireducens TaxID=3390813 RepID=UPI0034B4704E